MKTAFTYIHFVAAMLALIFLSGCRKEEGYAGNGGTGGGTEEEKPEVIVPEAPEEIVEGNVFVVDFFSDLEGGSGFFDTRDWNLAAGHILAQSGKRPVVYMFDGTGFSAGEVNPALRIANNVKGNAFFAQSEATSDHVDGTGIVTLYQISDYDGIVSGSTFMSGCTILLRRAPRYVSSLRPSHLLKMSPQSSMRERAVFITMPSWWGQSATEPGKKSKNIFRKTVE